ncbi:MAG: DUF6456 domain-containing protein [Pseudomonadota bacterium]
MTTKRDMMLAVCQAHAIETDDAGVFAMRQRYAHPLDALVEIVDPLTQRPYLTPDLYDAGTALSVLWMRAGIAPKHTANWGDEPRGRGAESLGTTDAERRFRDQCRALGPYAGLCIDVCCAALMPNERDARRLARGLERIAPDRKDQPRPLQVYKQNAA